MRYDKPISDNKTIHVDNGEPVLATLEHRPAPGANAVDAMFCFPETPETLAESLREKMEEMLGRMPERLARAAREEIEEAGGITPEMLVERDVVPEQRPVPIGEPDMGEGLTFVYRMEMN